MDLVELRADLNELTELRATSKRVRTRSAIDAAISEVQAAIQKITTSEPAPEEASTKDDEAAPENLPTPPPVPAPGATPISPTKPAPTPSAPPGGFVPITTFGLDLGGYNSAFVEIYVSLEGVGAVKDSVKCTFTKDSFDMQVVGLSGKNYRLLKSNLEHDIVPDDSKAIVKKNRVVIKLKKVKGDYSYDSWQNLTSKKDKAAKQKSKADPTAGIMDMMKDMYDSGDDNMKKIIGEAMMKSREGKTTDPMDSMSDF